MQGITAVARPGAEVYLRERTEWMMEKSTLQPKLPWQPLPVFGGLPPRLWQGRHLGVGLPQRLWQGRHFGVGLPQRLWQGMHIGWGCHHEKDR